MSKEDELKAKLQQRKTHDVMRTGAERAREAEKSREAAVRGTSGDKVARRVYVTFMTDTRTKTDLAKLARYGGVSTSELIHIAVRRYIEQNREALDIQTEREEAAERSKPPVRLLGVDD